MLAVGATARRYAEAVFEIGVQEGTIDRWRDDLHLLAEYLGNRRLAFVLKEPKIPFTRKEAIVRDLLAAKVRPEALNLALLLVERNLVELAPRVSAAFDERYNDYRGQAIAHVTTAIPLDDTLRAQISRELQAITGKHILLQERVDPAILGGVIARVGDTLIDGSLKRRFGMLRQRIVAGGLGGPDDGTLAALVGGPNGGTPGGSGGAGTPDGNQPFVVGPASGDSSTNGGSTGGGSAGSSSGPSSATSAAPRAGDGPHLAPRPPAEPGRPSPAPRSGGDDSRPNNGRPGGGRSKRRRR